MTRRTERIWLSPNYNLMQYSHKSKNLFNHANYIFKQQLQNSYFTSAYELMDMLRHHPTYTQLPSHSAQQTIKFLVKSWKGYFKALKSYKLNSNVTQPFLIKGKVLKSVNQLFNKKKAKLTSIYKLQNPGLKYLPYGKRMKHLLDKRYKRVEDLLHKISRAFVNYCISNNIDTVVIGYNEGWKQQVKMGKKNNQNFVNIPFLNLMRKIEYKSADVGIRIIRNEESYTSKCSFLDNEEIRKHSSYMGKRVKRGVFQSSTGCRINADFNGAGNIGRKVFPVEFTYGIVDVVSDPVCMII